MSLNDVYSQKYIPNPKSEALEYIDSVLHEAEEKVRANLSLGRQLRIWKGIHAKLTCGEYNEMMANDSLRGNPPAKAAPLRNEKGVISQSFWYL